ncbi:alanine/glycine:cation symporter family protein [Cloacibacillus porcorum]
MEQFLDYIVGILWGPTLLIGLLGTGIYFSLITKFWQIRHFFDSFRFCFFPEKRGEMLSADKVKVTPYQAACVAIAGSIGSGNIGGVASAIALGGPGVLFWMWMTALVGMMTKMVEVTLAVYYRKLDSDGRKTGGPLFYIERGLGSKFKFWGIFSLLFTVGIFMQLILAPEAYTVGESLHEVTGLRIIYLSAFFCLMCALVIWGGLRRVIGFASFMMPLMSVLYIVFGAYIILINITHIPAAIALIVKSAFTPMAAVGGFAGASFMLIARTGIARGLFSNEAGWGTSPMVHATADQRHPIEQGMWGVMEVFIDTIVICTITGMVIILTGEWNSGVSGSTLTINAFSHGLGKRFTAYFIAISLFLFSWTTVTGWYSYFHSILEYVFRNSTPMRRTALRILRITTPFFGLLMAYMIDVLNTNVSYAWLIVDISSSVPTYVNLIVLLLLSKTFVAILKDYEGPGKLFGLGEYCKVKVD